MKRIFTAVFLMLFAASAMAATTAAGKWRTYDDKTGKAKGEVIIYEEGGTFYGKIGKSLEPKEEQEEFCTKCPGEFKDKKILGLRFMWGFKRNGNNYRNGQILDPESGEIYNAQMTLKDNGNTLVLRGYVGIPMFGRSQTWERME